LIFNALDTERSQSLPFLYKGLALLTPGGDLVYCIDANKQGHWHLQLCQALQNLLQLPEAPLFLVPCYTATLDRWLHPHTQQLQVSAEAYPQVWRYRHLLSALFATSVDHWQMIKTTNVICDPAVIHSYQLQFPQLWQNHNFLIRLDQLTPKALSDPGESLQSQPIDTGSAVQSINTTPVSGTPSLLSTDTPQGYVLRLFVASHHTRTTGILENLHQLLDQELDVPYTLKVIDVSKHPERAEADQISATPTLVKIWPEPVKRLVGDQLTPDTVLQLLDPLATD
jgi:circadian clock protein KaiB